MAIKPVNRRPFRTLLTMLVLTVGLVGLLLGVHTWGTAELTPKLGLDLEGGQQVILKPQVRADQAVNDAELARAVDIMRARVDGQGVAEAEVSTLGERITVTVPGRMTQAQQEALRRSSQMRFRPVIGAMPANLVPQVVPSSAATGKGATAPRATATSKATPAPSAGGAGGAQAAPRAPNAPRATTATPTPTPTPTPKPSPAATRPPAPAGTPTFSEALAKDPKALIAYASSEAWATKAYQAQLTMLDCRKQPAYDPTREDLTKPIVACGEGDGYKYLLGPAVLKGDEIADATSGPGTNNQGQPDGSFVVNLKTTGDARTKYAEVSKYMQPLAEPRNQLAVVLDNQVISAPRFEQPILDGQARISGNFTAQSAKLLADQLKFGALPMSFLPESNLDISPTLGGDQLRKGIVAGLIGLGLVVLYSLVQYRALGLVTVASLFMVALLTYLAITILGWSSNLRLTMAGITGAIVAIGTTADSFIVYFERVRDEVRDGRNLRAAVETGWARAKRTILISDAVNFLAAAVLYVLASSNVRGFALMLMLTTILDVIVTFTFTHPLLSILATTKFFGSGHKWSGFDPERLGVSKFRYRGAGQFTVADRKRAGTGAGQGAGRPTGATAAGFEGGAAR